MTEATYTADECRDIALAAIEAAREAVLREAETFAVANSIALSRTAPKDAEGQCPDRCEGRIGHPGYHQSSDHAAIIREATAAAEQRLRAFERVAAKARVLASYPLVGAEDARQDLMAALRDVWPPNRSDAPTPREDTPCPEAGEE